MAVFRITSEPEQYAVAASLMEDSMSFCTKHTNTHKYYNLQHIK
jgi:hypothetical protein